MANASRRSLKGKGPVAMPGKRLGGDVKVCRNCRHWNQRPTVGTPATGRCSMGVFVDKLIVRTTKQGTATVYTHRVPEDFSCLKFDAR